MKYYSTKKLSHKTINKFSKFVLLGNNIDGYVDIKFHLFDSFDEIKKQFAKLVENIECWGEWDLKLYQVPDNFKIKELYGYYKLPQQGKLILELSYMNISKNISVYINDALIHIHTWSDVFEEELVEDSEQILHGSICEDFTTILLFQEKRRKAFVIETYAIENEKCIALNQ
jgi:hypothetical protein